VPGRQPGHYSARQRRPAGQLHHQRSRLLPSFGLLLSAMATPGLGGGYGSQGKRYGQGGCRAKKRGSGRGHHQRRGSLVVERVGGSATASY